MSNVIPLYPESMTEDETFKTVEIDITLISNDLYDQILREFHIQHGRGIYVEWKITATQGRA